jgi:hypothetical protein
MINIFMTVKMPRKKHPISLFQIGINVFVNWFIKAWQTNSQQVKQNFGPEIHKLLSLCIPSVVADSLILHILETYVQTYECIPDPDMSVFLQSVMLPQLNVLDLSKLMCLGVNHNEHFENVIASALHSLGRLVKISLRTHGRDVTLPICNNHILNLIGRNCPNLKSVDVSYNSSVDDVGLKYLIPCSRRPGCPLIEEIFVYECDVSVEGMADILSALPNIRLIGYKKIVSSILHLHKQLTRSNSHLEDGLKLTHVDNGRKYLYERHVQFSERIVSAVRTLCPHLCNLKACVTDQDVPRLELFESLTSLELIYNIWEPTSPGKGTEHFLQLRGAQLSSLAIICDVFHEKQIIMLGENCSHLKHLYLKCNRLELCDLELKHYNVLSKCKFFILESLYFHIGRTEYCVSLLPVRVVQCILCNTDRLEELKLVVNSSSISDVWMHQLFSSVNTAVLKNLLITLPGRNENAAVIDLSMSSVHMIINCTPHLQKLGNLLFWNVRPKQVWKLQFQLEDLNFDLNILYQSMTVK